MTWAAHGARRVVADTGPAIESQRSERSLPSAMEIPVPAAKRTPYDKIRDAIVSGELAGGTPLTESSLAAWCGVSRTPIREALLRLEQDGLIVRTERGPVVRSRSPEEILDIYEVRIALEATAARS